MWISGFTRSAAVGDVPVLIRRDAVARIDKSWGGNQSDPTFWVVVLADATGNELGRARYESESDRDAAVAALLDDVVEV